MSYLLVPETIGALEAAAARRFVEGEYLRGGGLRLAAIYLYGYSIELRLKTAYFRTLGCRSANLITPDDREAAEKHARSLSLMVGAPHDLAGWARLLTYTRADLHRGYPRRIEQELLTRITEAYEVWRPALRYSSVVPYSSDLDLVRSAAGWLRRTYTQL